ncbi:NYN domain-containing protein [Oligosphaera ethanolica]|uniref:HTH OST-type domain-containing protein n=1 Tax=Oligosphaera ethanolica TaxID=760260 RepID=A0AAE3VK30_9BACT|nr:NYN domain-containing protein [Oligosphaera ethanolica]MDQ0291860.1 hypothetical protein [Oligosphaera ethanolica]
MESHGSQKKIAVLIDAENTALSTLKAVLEVIAGKGHITLQRAYGDWSKDGLKRWRDVLNEMAIESVHHFACTKGKNASDGLMIIDAMDLLYSKEFDAFALVTSDSDFTVLAKRLRASGLWVIGLGEKKTPESFKLACDDFVRTDSLAAAATPAAETAEAKNSNTAKNKTASPAAKTASPAAKTASPAAKTASPAAKTPSPAAKTPSPAASPPSPASPAKTTANAESKNEVIAPPQPPPPASPSQNKSDASKVVSAAAQSGVADVSEIILLLKAAWKERQRDGWIDCCGAAAFVKKAKPDFIPKTYGARKFTDLITSLPDVFEFHKSPGTPAGRFLFRPKE